MTVAMGGTTVGDMGRGGASLMLGVQGPRLPSTLTLERVGLRTGSVIEASPTHLPRRSPATHRVVSASASTSPTPHRGTITGTAAAAPAVTDATSTSLAELQEAAGYFLKSAPNDLKFQRTVRGKGTIYGSVPRAPDTGKNLAGGGRGCT